MLARVVPEELAEKLFSAAFECFSERGFERTRMDEIAARSGVARATLYYYFRGKDDLFLFLLQRGIGVMRAALDEVSARAGTGRERLEAALDKLIELFVEHRHVCLVVFQQIGRMEQQHGEVHDWLQRESAGALRGIIEAGAKDGTLRRVDPEMVAPAVFGAALWSVLHRLRNEEVPTGAVQREVRALVMGGLARV